MKRVAIILYDSVNALDVTGPLEAFAAVRIVPDAPGYEVVTWSVDDATVVAESGIRFVADGNLPQLPSADLLIIPGGAGLRDPARLAKVSAWLKKHALRFIQIASVCTGAYALAASGLCDNRRLVTHWRFGDDLQKRYPNVKVESDALFVKDGKFWSSGGITSGIDLALSIIEEDIGAKVSAAAARELVVFLRRTGSQSQFSEPLKLQAMTSDALSEACVWAANNLSQIITVEALAARAGLGPRQFSRRFKAMFDTSPANYLNRLRLDSARMALAQRGAVIERVASASGFQSLDGFRRAFDRQFGITPGEYQKRFRQ